MQTYEERFLQLLADRYPNIPAATTEMINLSAILQLPKGTEHFLSDLHGESEAFHHILKNASGVIRRKIDEVFDKLLTASEKTALATLVYYPEERLSYLKKQELLSSDWYRVTLYRLVELCRVVASKYTRSKVRKALPREFGYIIEELLHEHTHFQDKERYYTGIIETIIDLDRADAFIIAISELIQRLAIDRLHILGDIYDRGPFPDVILDTLRTYHSVDISWGNHDVLWMGAAAGNTACIASVLRIAARYDSLETIEDSYGISLRQLFWFAENFYRDDPCECFLPVTEHSLSPHTDVKTVSKVQKAIAIIQFKLEGQLIARHPEYQMEHRLLLDKIDVDALVLDGVRYPLSDSRFPTVDWSDPYRLTDEEAELIEKLKQYFLHSGRLQKHIRFLFSKGAMYTVMNGNLLYHGCIPATPTGEFASFLTYSGKALLDYCDKTLRKGYFLPWEHPQKGDCLDFYWYLWSGENSPLFGKRRMATFERYFVLDKALHKEEKNAYYRLISSSGSEDFVIRILNEFHLSSATSHIINGHMPVQQKKGESPVKAGGKLFVIDGGLAKSYQKRTGIAGYTLIFNSHGFLLTAHQPFSSTVDAVQEQTDIVSQTVVSEPFGKRMCVEDTDTGKLLSMQIEELDRLTKAYRSGELQERF